MTFTVNKGDRIRAAHSEARMVALAGAQLKFEVNGSDLLGTVRHIRGDHPTHPNPASVTVLIDPDPGHWVSGPPWLGVSCGACATRHVQIPLAHIREVLPGVYTTPPTPPTEENP